VSDEGRPGKDSAGEAGGQSSIVNRQSSILLIGYGNPGRLDDGLGPELARRIEKRNLPGVTVDANYQLSVEDAAEAAKADVVIFADADTTGPEPFSVRRIRGGDRPLSFSSHSVAPDAVLALARDLFGREPEAWLVGIRGYAFDEFGERLSDGAKRNLDAAVEHLTAAIENGALCEVRSGPSEPFEEDQICKTASS
jgi:hydrogenase maturation protease